MGMTEIIRTTELLLPLVARFRRKRRLRDMVGNHELFHYLRLIEAQKLPLMSRKKRTIYKQMVEDYVPAFESVLEESRRNLFDREYWERFMKGRQRMIPIQGSQTGEEFFHLEKVIFQSIRDDIYRDKYLFLYHIFSMYLLFLKTLIDSSGGDADDGGD